jgi:hypothetical protein
MRTVLKITRKLRVEAGAVGRDLKKNCGWGGNISEEV